LQLSLYEKAKELGVEFKFGEKVVSVDFNWSTVLATDLLIETSLSSKHLTRVSVHGQSARLGGTLILTFTLQRSEQGCR
jgi:hypothetical protein